MKVVKIVRLKVSDADRLCELANDFEIWSNLRDTMPHPYLKSDAEAFINTVLLEKSNGTFAIHYENELCGVIGVKLGSDVYRLSAELGFWIGKTYWGNGITSEAVNKIIPIAFNELGIVRMHAAVFQGNLASMKVLERNGFKQIGIGQNAVIKNGKMLNEHYFELLKS